MRSAGSTTFFSADDGVHGDELWVTDGNEAGTHLVKDINPGLGDADPELIPGTLTGGKVVFRRRTNGVKEEISASDGMALPGADREPSSPATTPFSGAER